MRVVEMDRRSMLVTGGPDRDQNETVIHLEHVYREQTTLNESEIKPNKEQQRRTQTAEPNQGKSQ